MNENILKSAAPFEASKWFLENRSNNMRNHKMTKSFHEKLLFNVLKGFFPDTLRTLSTLSILKCNLWSETCLRYFRKDKMI
jgi:hypothetical protein